MSNRSLNCLTGEKLTQTQLCVLHRRASISGAGRGYVFQLGRQKVVGINWKNFCKRCIVRISKIDCILHIPYTRHYNPLLNTNHT